jgi:hypothetical protein
VQIEDGREVVGGTAGDLIPIDVAFAASSTAGRVTEMRVGNICAADRDLSARPWEPFAATKTYSTTAAINFVGWYVSVQYRDTHGNLSPIYCDDISVEGMPAPPPTPAP